MNYSTEIIFLYGVKEVEGDFSAKELNKYLKWETDDAKDDKINEAEEVYTSLSTLLDNTVLEAMVNETPSL